MTSTTSEPNPRDLADKGGVILPNMAVRVITALVLLPVILFGSFVGGWLFTIMVMLLTAIASMEFYYMETGREAQGSALTGVPMALIINLAAMLNQAMLGVAALGIGLALTTALETARHPRRPKRTILQVLSTLGATLYIAFPMSFLIAIRNIPLTGIIWLFVIYAVTWGTDTFAYLGGRAIGRTKLAPLLSPKKTVEGAIIGIIGGIIPSLIILYASHLLSVPSLIAVCIGPFVAIMGDLFESALKRFFQVKDSRIRGLNLFPGHGGVLDRIDALLWVITLFYIFLTLTGPYGGLFIGRG